MLKRVQHDVEGIELTYEVILNLVQDLTEDWLVKARGEMLKRVQHDIIRQPPLMESALLFHHKQKCQNLRKLSFCYVA